MLLWHAGLRDFSRGRLRAEEQKDTMIDRWIVSPFTVVAWRGGRIEITSSGSGATLVADDIEVVRLMHAFAQPRSVEDVLREFGTPVPERLPRWIDLFIRAGVLSPASECEAATVHHWDWSALAYHRRSRRPGLQKTTPGQTTPAAPTRAVETWIPLVRGYVDAGRDLANVLEARRSWRAWSAAAIPLQTLSSLLWLSARNRVMLSERRQDAYLSRPYPSGGAVYSLDLYLVIAADAVETIPTGLYKYLPDCHGLEPVSTRNADIVPFLEAAGRSAGTTAPPIVVLVTSRFAEPSVAYGELAYSLVLKEVGCLFQTLYLVGEYLNLGPCALGGGTPAGRLARVCNTSELADPVVGEFMFGPR